MADYGELYKKMGEDYDVNTAAYRFAVILKTLNYSLPEDIPVLTSDTASELLTQDMSGQIEKLLFLFGADVITEEDVNRLFGISQDISGVLNEAESFLKMDNKRTEKERMLREVFRTALVCAAVSAQYTSEDERLSFDDARKIIGLKSVEIVNGYVKVRNKNLLELLIKCGESFGHAGTNVEADNNIENLLGDEDVRNGNTGSACYPIMMTPKHLKYYDDVFNRAYGADFIEYAVEHDIKPDEQYISRFEQYRSDIKCKFTISSYERKRRICGDKINQFDYFLNVENEKLNVDRRDTVTVDQETEKSEEELLRIALDKYCGKIPVQNDTVLEVLHNQKIMLFVIKDHDYVPLESESFRSRLFDLEEMWGKIIAYTGEHPLKLINGKLEIPIEFINQFDVDIREYAANLIAEQYSRQRGHSMGNKVISKLSELEEDAAEKSGRKQRMREQRERLKQERRKSYEPDNSDSENNTEGW